MNGECIALKVLASEAPRGIKPAAQGISKLECNRKTAVRSQKMHDPTERHCPTETALPGITWWNEAFAGFPVLKLPQK